MKFLIAFLFVAQTAAAAPLSGYWNFTRTDGVVGMVHLGGDFPSCTVYPAGNEANIFLSVKGAPSLALPACYEGVQAPSSVKTFFTYGSHDVGAEIQVDYADKFSADLDDMKKYGGPVYKIGGYADGACTAGANALLLVPGAAVGDPDDSVGGYCLTPSQD